MHLILGMHRCGTSLIARLAALAGADLGDPAGFHPADRWNPDGYFEQREILDVNIALVNGLFGKASYFLLPGSDRVRARARRRADEIRRLGEAYRDRVVKENRFCITLDGWRHVGPTPRRVLLVFRDPRAVARSLARRDHIPHALSNRLWRQHLERALAATDDLERRVLWYDDLIGDDAGMEDSIAKLAWLGDLDATALGSHARDVVRSSGSAPPVPAESELPGEVGRLYRHLIDEARGPA